MSSNLSHKQRFVSRRDQVMCLLTPISVRNQPESLSKSDRLFSEKAPTPTYESFRPKALRRLTDWTFYSAPTRGESELLTLKTQTISEANKKENVSGKVKKYNCCGAKKAHSQDFAKPACRMEERVIRRSRSAPTLSEVPIDVAKQLQNQKSKHTKRYSDSSIPEHNAVDVGAISENTTQRSSFNTTPTCEELYNNCLTTNTKRTPYCSIRHCRKIEPGNEILVKTVTLESRGNSLLTQPRSIKAANNDKNMCTEAQKFNERIGTQISDVMQEQQDDLVEKKTS